MLWNELVPGDLILVRIPNNMNVIISGEMVIGARIVDDIFTVTFIQLWGDSLTVLNADYDTRRGRRVTASYKYTNDHCDVIPKFYEIIKTPRDV